MLAVPIGSLSTSKTNVWGIFSRMAVARWARSNTSSKGSLPRIHSSHLQRPVPSTRSGRSMADTTDVGMESPLTQVGGDLGVYPFGWDVNGVVPKFLDLRNA